VVGRVGEERGGEERRREEERAEVRGELSTWYKRTLHHRTPPGMFLKATAVQEPTDNRSTG